MTNPDPAAFRRATGQFATGIVVIAATVEGVTHAMTVNVFSSVSLDPLLVLVCVEKAARFHGAMLAAGTWAVSVLSEDAEKTARWLATRAARSRASSTSIRIIQARPPVPPSSMMRCRRSNAARTRYTTAATTASCSARSWR